MKWNRWMETIIYLRRGCVQPSSISRGWVTIRIIPVNIAKNASIHCSNISDFVDFTDLRGLDQLRQMDRIIVHRDIERIRECGICDTKIRHFSLSDVRGEHRREINSIAKWMAPSASCLLSKFSCTRREKWPIVRHGASTADYVHLNWKFWTTVTAKSSTCAAMQVVADAVSHVVCKLWMSVHRQASESGRSNKNGRFLRHNLRWKMKMAKMWCASWVNAVHHFDFAENTFSRFAFVASNTSFDCWIHDSFQIEAKNDEFVGILSGNGMSSFSVSFTATLDVNSKALLIGALFLIVRCMNILTKGIAQIIAIYFAGFSIFAVTRWKLHW